MPDIIVYLAAVYFFFVFMKQGLKRRFELRAVSLLIACMILPILIVIYYCEISTKGDINNPAHFWIIPVNVGENESRDCNLLTGALILSLVYIGITAVVYIIDFYYYLKQQGHLLSIHKVLIKLSVLLVGVIIYLKSQGIDLTPLWVGMGAASLILGFALQDPLSNLIKGVSLDIEGVIKRGEWIRVGGENGIAGKVVEKNWRTTRIQTIDDVLVTIPNNVMGSETIINYHQPTTSHVQRLYVGTSYNDPPVKVKEILRTILMRNQRVLKNPAPRVKTIKYNDFSIDYELKFWILNYGDHPSINDEVMTQIWYSFKFYGIEIPFPIRTVHMKEQDHLRKESSAIDENVVDINTFLKSLSFFADHLNYKDFNFLSRNSFQKRYSSGEHILYKGMMGDALYIVREGPCVVVLANGEKRSIEAGAYFGEMGLISSKARIADVLAGDQGSVTVRIDRECMNILFRKYSGLRKEFEHVRDVRMEDAGIISEVDVKKKAPFMIRFVNGVRDFIIPW